MSKQKFGKDNWLYILTNAIVNYVDEGGEVGVTAGNDGAITITLNGVQPGDRRLHSDFEALGQWVKVAT